MAITPHYTVVGSPIISGDYLLTGTNASNYLTFNDYGVFDSSKPFDIIFKFRKTITSGYSGILTLGNSANAAQSICIFSYASSISCRIGSRTISISGMDITSDDYYYRFSVESIPTSTTYVYIRGYISEDGDNWEQKVSTTFLKTNLPTISTANNIIGVFNTYYLISSRAFLDLKELKIINNGNLWFKACDVTYDPTVIATEVFSLNKTFRGKAQIETIDCNNVQFKNNDMSKAFVNCSNLTQVTNINQNTTNMAYTFAGCNTSIYDTGFPAIPNSVNDITGLFAYHTDWTNLPQQVFNNTWAKIPNRLKENMAGFFDGCSNMSNVPSNIIPNSITNMAYTFRNCQAMTDMPIITENVVDMSNTFYNCSNMINANYSIPNSVVNMSNAFNGCSNLSKIPNLNNATNIENVNYAFYNCSNMIDGNCLLSNKIVSMYYTFGNCQKMTTSPVIPNSVIDMNYAFWNCNGLTVAPAIPGSVTTMKNTFENCQTLTTPPAIPDSVVNMYATFTGCRNLTTTTPFPNNVIDVSWAYENCPKLITPPVIPQGVKYLQGTFRYCNNLQTAPVIPDSVTTVEGAFLGTNITVAPEIPNSVVRMVITFFGCRNLTTPPSFKDADSVSVMWTTFSGCPKITTIQRFPLNVDIMYGCFNSCTNLVSVPPIPSKVTNMLETFNGCTNLTGNIYIKSENVIYAGNCFRGSEKIKNVYIPFTYTNGVNTQTYNSYTSSGYKTDGTVNGVYLKDISLVDDSVYSVNVTDDTIYLNTYIGSSAKVVVPMSKTQGE